MLKLFQERIGIPTIIQPVIIVVDIEYIRDAILIRICEVVVQRDEVILLIIHLVK